MSPSLTRSDGVSTRWLWFLPEFTARIGNITEVARPAWMEWVDSLQPTDKEALKNALNIVAEDVERGKDAPKLDAFRKKFEVCKQRAANVVAAPSAEMAECPVCRGGWIWAVVDWRHKVVLPPWELPEKVYWNDIESHQVPHDCAMGRYVAPGNWSTRDIESHERYMLRGFWTIEPEPEIKPEKWQQPEAYWVRPAAIGDMMKDVTMIMVHQPRELWPKWQSYWKAVYRGFRDAADNEASNPNRTYTVELSRVIAAIGQKQKATTGKDKIEGVKRLF